MHNVMLEISYNVQLILYHLLLYLGYSDTKESNHTPPVQPLFFD